MVRSMLRFLFVAAFSFVFLSSTAAQALGLAELRVLVFAMLIGICALVALLGAPALRRAGRGLPVVCTALLLLLLPLQLAEPFDPLDWKILLVLLVLFTAPEMARLVPPPELVILVRRLLAIYVAASGLYLLGSDTSLLVRGADGLARWDISGSLVTHASLCALYLVLASERLAHGRDMVSAAWYASTGALALVMLFLAATRTTLLIFALLLLFHLATASRPGAWRPALLLVLSGAAVFTLFTLFVSDTLWVRLGGGGEDFTSGRGHSLSFWLAQALAHPAGLGIGAVRRMLADGRPAVEGGRLLEWPHNEFVRFWVEGGWLGLAFITVLVCGLLVRTLRLARRETCPATRLLALAIAADLLAQSQLQNYFNNIYYATMMVAVLAMLHARRPDAEDWAQPSPQAAPSPVLAKVSARA